jgi:hypothetical protein
LADEWQNIRYLVRDNDIVPQAYDFDLSSMVNGKDGNFGLIVDKVVEQKIPSEFFIAARQVFLDKRAEITALADSYPLDDDGRANIHFNIERFYDYLAKAKTVPVSIP